MKYGKALESVEGGRKILRDGWNGKGMYVFLFSMSSFCLKHEHGYDYPMDDDSDNPIAHIGFDTDNQFIPLSDFLLLKTAQNTCVPWIPSQSDQLADDWEIVITR